MGIVDNDLKYIIEIKPNKYRIIIKDSNGKKISKTVYDIVDAINEKNLMLKEISKLDKYKKNDYSNITIDEGIKLYLDYKKKQSDNNQIELSTYEDNLSLYNSRFIRNNDILIIKIVDFDKRYAQNYIDWLYSQKPVIGGEKKLSINTIANPFKFLNGAFNFFIDELEVIDVNPFSKIKNKPKYKPRNQNYLINEEIKIVLDALDNKSIRFKAFINLFLETGLRIEEITALKWSDLNKFRLTISIKRALIKSRITNNLIIKDVKTDGSEREIGISETAFDYLLKLRKFKECCGQIITNDDYIFSSWESNEMIGPDKYTKEWKKFIEKLGFKNLPLRNLRHTVATFMLQGDTNIEAVKKRFGWTKDSTVMGIYNQSGRSEDRMLVRKFEEEFRNTLGLSFADLYKISINKFYDERKLKKFIEDVTNEYIDSSNFDEELKRCQQYLFELYPMFKKIASINDSLSDEEIDAVFEGFTKIYKQIKIMPLDKNMEFKI